MKSDWENLARANITCPGFFLIIGGPLKTYTVSEAREKLASLLDQAARKGEVRIRRRDGKVFAVKLSRRPDSPLDVPGRGLGLTRKDILESIREGRRQR